MAKCSVLVLAYNQEKYIRQCLDGVLMQRADFEYELVVGEDYSTDSTRKICEEYAMKNPAVRVLSTSNGENLGYTENWKRTLAECRGEYIAICEGDDYWTDALKLQKQVEYLDAHPRCGLCYTDCNIYYEDTGIWERAIFANGQSNMNHENVMWGDGYRGNLTWVIRRDVLADVVIPKHCSDVPLCLLYEIFLRSELGFLKDVTGVFRKHVGSFSNTPTDRRKDYWYHRNYTVMRLKYAALMPNAEFTCKHCYGEALSLYETAKEFGDSEYMGLIADYYKSHDDELYDYLMQQNRRIAELNQELERLQTSKKYKVGTLVLKPFSYLRKKV